MVIRKTIVSLLSVIVAASYCMQAEAINYDAVKKSAQAAFSTASSYVSPVIQAVPRSAWIAGAVAVAAYSFYRYRANRSLFNRLMTVVDLDSAEQICKDARQEFDFEYRLNTLRILMKTELSAVALSNICDRLFTHAENDNEELQKLDNEIESRCIGEITSVVREVRDARQQRK